MGISTLLAVTIGGALGALGRYTVSTWVQNSLGGAFPWGTLSVNVVGSFLTGVLVAAVQRGALPSEFQTLAAVGILGSFTTFSAFSIETLNLIQADAWVRGSRLGDGKRRSRSDCGSHGASAGRADPGDLTCPRP